MHSITNILFSESGYYLKSPTFIFNDHLRCPPKSSYTAEPEMEIEIPQGQHIKRVEFGMVKGFCKSLNAITLFDDSNKKITEAVAGNMEI